MTQVRLTTLKFEKSGYLMMFNASRDKKDGLTNVSLMNTGNVDLRKLPFPPGAKFHPNRSEFINTETTLSVDDAFKFYRNELPKLGWKEVKQLGQGTMQFTQKLDTAKIRDAELVRSGHFWEMSFGQWTNLGYFLQYRLFGMSEVGFHAVNWLLHTAVACVLFAFGRDFLRDRWPAGVIVQDRFLTRMLGKPEGEVIYRAGVVIGGRVVPPDTSDRPSVGGLVEIGRASWRTAAPGLFSVFGADPRSRLGG